MFDKARALPCRWFVEVLDMRTLVPLGQVITPTAGRIREVMRKITTWS